jgi:arylsulfatase A-like enzyme
MRSFAPDRARSSRAHLPSSGLLLAALAGCGGGGDSNSPPPPAPPTNVLVVVLDDWGIDNFGRYGAHPDAPPTPTLDALADIGVLFRRAYVSPTCSPTRAQILTGRHSFRIGVGEPINDWQNVPALAFDEVTLPEIFDAVAEPAIATSAVGKWHLGSVAVGGADHPTLQGFDGFSGTLGNLFFGETFTSYAKVVNGVSQPSSVYATTEQVDDALARIAAMPQPWFLYLSFNAPHKPFHVPPAHLHTYTLSGDPEQTAAEHYRAAVQALDAELGRLLASMDAEVRANTTVVVVGDNGTPNEAATPPAVDGQNKGTLYEGGVNVPLIVAGKHVEQPGRESDALVHAVDVFATLAELLEVDYRAGIGDNRPVDGLSFADVLRDPAAPGPRTSVFVERFSPNGPGPYSSQGWMVRDVRWKLMRRVGQADLFFDMQGQLREPAPLDLGALDPEQQAAYDALVAELANVLGS